MVAELDPHSAYMPPEDNAVFRSDTEGAFGGVGLEVEQRDDRVIVIAPIEGSPADRAGIKPGDRILAVAGDSTRGAPFEQLMRRMRGQPGTTVEVVVITPGHDKERKLSLVREIIKVKSVVARRLAGDVAYLRIKQFQASTHAEMLEAVGRLRDGGKPIGSLVLDLRQNPGGLVDQAIAVADELLPGGVVYTTRARGKVIDEVTAGPGGALVATPLVVLVDEFSASASELVAGALQDNKRGTIVGARTFGKGSVQSILSLPNGAGMRLTTMRFFTPSGHVIQAEGITPDVLVERAGAEPPVRERDVPGHLGPDDGLPDHAPTPRPSRREATPDGGAPDGDDGITKNVPEDPSGGRDRALSVAFELAKRLAKK
jgi:carboxyl-terminal processing protease